MVKKLFTYLILPLAIAALAYLCVASIMEPVNFNKEKAFREEIAIGRLKDIRTFRSPTRLKTESSHPTLTHSRISTTTARSRS